MNIHLLVQYYLIDNTMPLPTPKTDESVSAFIARCMSDAKTQSEYPDAQQRIAVCIAQYDKK